MTERPRICLEDWLQEAEIDAHILVQQEESVRADWWRASCTVHDWYTTGSKPNVEDAAAYHVRWDHLACAAPIKEDLLVRPAMYCRLLPNHHGDDHANGGFTWPKIDRPAEPAAAKLIRCPLASCRRILDEPRPVADWMLLAQSLGMDIEPLRALDYLREHLETHTVIEFITEISRLTNLLEEERAGFRAGMEGV